MDIKARKQALLQERDKAIQGMGNLQQLIHRLNGAIAICDEVLAEEAQNAENHEATIAEGVKNAV